MAITKKQGGLLFFISADGPQNSQHETQETDYCLTLQLVTDSIDDRETGPDQPSDLTLDTGHMNSFSTMKPWSSPHYAVSHIQTGWVMSPR